jgi:hypothetical protein
LVSNGIEDRISGSVSGLVIEAFMRRFAITLGMLGLATALPADEPPANDDLFPLRLNNRWTYSITQQNQVQEERLIVTASLMDKFGGPPSVRLDGRLRGQIIATELLSIRSGGAYRLRADAVDIEPPLLICKFPCKKGETWKIDYKVGAKKATVTYESDVDEVEVKAGKFKTVLIRSEVPEGNGRLKNSCWYAPKFGLVKQVIDDGESKIVLELEKFDRVPKK